MQKHSALSNYDDNACSNIGKELTIFTSSTSKSSRRSVKLLAAEAENKQHYQRHSKLLNKLRKNLSLLNKTSKTSIGIGKRSETFFRKAQCMEKLGSFEKTQFSGKAKWCKKYLPPSQYLPLSEICLQVKIYLQVYVCLRVIICL